MTAEALPEASQPRCDASKWPVPPALDPVNKKYVSTGVHHDRLTLSVPYDIDIDLTAIDRL